MKKFKILLITLFLMALNIIYIYICAIESIPKNTILFQGEKLNLKTIFGISLVEKNSDYKTILTSSTVEDEGKYNEIGTTALEVKLFGTLNVKDINVNVIERTKVIPVGQVSGLKLYTSGVLVVGMSEIKGKDNQNYKPYENSGIQEGDTIVEIEGTQINDTKELIDIVNKSKGRKLKIKYLREKETEECSIKPIQTSATEYKLGLWVRDSAAGIGTMTFYEPKTGNFAALGHGITDIDTGELINIQNGEFVTANIISIIKGKEGKPGKIQGSIKSQNKIGSIYKNSNLGVYGKSEDLSELSINNFKETEVAMRNEIKLRRS